MDDSQAELVTKPASISELAALIRQASREDRALFPRGGKTMRGVGLPPDRPGTIVDVSSLNQILDFPARDMTVTVQAGVTVGELERVVSAENLRLPVDVPRADDATLGGSIAVNVSGSRRYGFGTLRDYVIGISFMSDEGHEVKAGGRVVKNVAGYDLCKLQVGALGTLGILTQITLKLRPRPEECAVVTIGCDAERLQPLLDQLHQSRTRPVCLDVLNRRAAQTMSDVREPPLPDADWVVVVCFEDNSEAVHWQVQELVRETSTTAPQCIDARVGTGGAPLWNALREMRLHPASVLTFKINDRPSRVANLCRFIEALPDAILVHAHAGNGIVLGHVTDALTPERASALLEQTQRELDDGPGNVVVLDCPAEWKKSLPIWGKPRNDAWLMCAVKEKLDPRRLFNPGCFVDGI